MLAVTRPRAAIIAARPLGLMLRMVVPADAEFSRLNLRPSFLGYREERE